VFHAPFILANPDKFILSVVVERSATAEKSKARDLYPGVKVVNTLEEALKEDVDAFWVLSINSTHYDFAKQILNAGKHVVVEKPVTSTAAEAEELAALAKEKNLVLAVYQNRRCVFSVILSLGLATPSPSSAQS
jgi:predicted dehydrogenase